MRMSVDVEIRPWEVQNRLRVSLGREVPLGSIEKFLRNRKSLEPIPYAAPVIQQEVYNGLVQDFLKSVVVEDSPKESPAKTLREMIGKDNELFMPVRNAVRDGNFGQATDLYLQSPAMQSCPLLGQKIRILLERIKHELVLGIDTIPT